MTTSQATAPSKSAPRGPRFRVATFGIALLLFLGAIVWHSISLHREIAALEDQIKPEQQKQAQMADVKLSYDDLQHELQEYQQTVAVIQDLQKSGSADDPVPALHALGRVLSSTPNVSVVSIAPRPQGDGEVKVNIELTAPTAAAAEKFRDAVESTGSFRCSKKVDGYAPGTLSISCDLAPSKGGRQ